MRLKWWIELICDFLSLTFLTDVFNQRSKVRPIVYRVAMNISGNSSNWDISSFYDKLCPVIANDMEIRTILCEVWRKILELNSLISLITFFSRELVDGPNTVCIDGTLTVICLPDDSDHRTKFLRCKQDVSLFFTRVYIWWPFLSLATLMGQLYDVLIYIHADIDESKKS